MSPRTTGLLAVTAALLGAFVWFHEIEGGAERAAFEAAEAQVFVGFDQGDVDEIALTTLDGVDARFERREGRWWLVAPVLARADATALGAMASALANLPTEGRVSGEPTAADFALGRDPDAPGAARRLIRFEAGGASRGLRIGRTTPVGGHRYVARLDSDEIDWVASYRVNAFERNLADLRDRSLFEFVPDDLERLSLSRPGIGLTIELARRADGEWQIVAPFEAAADPEVMRAVVSNLAHLRVRDFVDEPGEIEPALREDAALEIELRLRGEAGARRVRFAGGDSRGRLFDPGDGMLYWVAEERLEEFPIEVDAFRFKRLADFDLASARRLVLQFVEDEQDRSAALDVVVELGETGWSSAGRDLDPDRVTRLVRDLSNLAADAIVADAMGEAERAALGLSPPRARLRVEGSAEPNELLETLADLRFGRLDASRGLFVQRADRSTIFVVAPEAAEALPYSADHYRFAFEFEPTDVAGGAFETETADAVESGADALDVDPLEGLDAP